jgi:hypothetical protein
MDTNLATVCLKMITPIVYNDVYMPCCVQVYLCMCVCMCVKEREKKKEREKEKG